VPDAFQTPIDAATRYCAVLGHPIRHSASPAMQNAGLAALGLNWRYLAFDVRPEELRETLAGAKAMRFIGLNLTVPHKVLAVDLVDVVDERARRYGAVNTVRFEGQTPSGAWLPLAQLADAEVETVRSHGFNTDAEGFILSVREELPELTLAGASVLLIGTGGAGRTVALRLAQESVRALFLIDVDQSRAQRVTREIEVAFPGVRVQLGYPEAGQPADLLINATPLGLKEDDAPPLDEQRFPISRARCVYDLVYRPAETALLRRARAAGCRAANGLGMLLHQGTAALELWTGRPAPVPIMRRALEQNVYGH
jgi:shikimate dehydrogenase